MQFSQKELKALAGSILGDPVGPYERNLLFRSLNGGMPASEADRIIKKLEFVLGKYKPNIPTVDVAKLPRAKPEDDSSRTVFGRAWTFEGHHLVVYGVNYQFKDLTDDVFLLVEDEQFHDEDATEYKALMLAAVTEYFLLTEGEAGAFLCTPIIFVDVPIRPRHTSGPIFRLNGKSVEMVQFPEES